MTSETSFAELPTDGINTQEIDPALVAATLKGMAEVAGPHLAPLKSALNLGHDTILLLVAKLDSMTHGGR